MPKYTVKSPLNHDKKEHEVGSTIDLAEDAAQPLVQLGVLVAAVPEKKDEGKKADGKPKSD